jgi:alkanesulfonate monooxygenase SsuD/methylene tetrahydromethanopterin reductase-like flavin-dependent oxidoreductase (luciferase family)
MSDRIGALHDAVRAAHGGGYPVWVGGRAAQVREIVAVADGWNAWGVTPHEFARESTLVREIAPAATITWGGLVLLGDDAAAASEKASSRTLPPGVIVGGPGRVATELDEYVERGAEWVIAGPVDASDPDNAAILGEVRTKLNS